MSWHDDHAGIPLGTDDEFESAIADSYKRMGAPWLGPITETTTWRAWDDTVAVLGEERGVLGSRESEERTVLFAWTAEREHRVNQCADWFAHRDHVRAENLTGVDEETARLILVDGCPCGWAP